MATGLTLVLAVLLLGGVIATVGDRLGTRVGKARLSLFNLRPRKTAVLITILTGSLISGLTLMLLILLNGQLRAGLFQLEKIQKERKDARRDLEQARQDKLAIETQLTQAEERQTIARRQLLDTERSLQGALQRQTKTQGELSQARRRADALRQDALRLSQEQQSLIRQREQVLREIALRNQDIARQSQALRQRDGAIAQQGKQLSRQTQALNTQSAEIRKRDQRIAQQQAAVAAGESKVKALDREIADRERDLQQRSRELEQVSQGLAAFLSNDVVLNRGEILASGFIQVTSPNDLQRFLALLQQSAQTYAVERVKPGIKSPRVALGVEAQDWQRLIQALSTGQPHVVRVRAARNVLRGEDQVPLDAEWFRNQLIFPAGQFLASIASETSLDSRGWSNRLDDLVRQANFRAEQAEMPRNTEVTLGDGRIQTWVNFIQELGQQGKPLTLKVFTAAPLETRGPLNLEIVAYDAEDNPVLRLSQFAIAKSQTSTNP